MLSATFICLNHGTAFRLPLSRPSLLCPSLRFIFGYVALFRAPFPCTNFFFFFFFSLHFVSFILFFSLFFYYVVDFRFFVFFPFFLCSIAFGRSFPVFTIFLAYICRLMFSYEKTQEAIGQNKI